MNRFACRLGGLGLGILLAVGTPASGEIYRWTDAAGREHFTTDLGKVPAEQREAARDGAASGRRRFNVHEAPTRAPRSEPPPASATPSAPASADPAWSCQKIRREAKKLQKVITYHRKKIASYQRLADDIERSDFQRRKYEARGEESAVWLAKGQAAYDAFAEEQRRKGVPPGCLRP